MPAILGTTDANLTYDFRRAAGNSITPANGWGHASGVALDDIDSACEVIRANGKMRADGIFMGSATLAYFLTNAQVVAYYANKLYYNLLSFQPGETVPPWAKRLEAAGAIIYGKLRTPAGRDLVVFTYDASYLNESSVDTRFMPTDEAFVFASGARCDRYFGPPDTLPMIPQTAQWYTETFGFNPNTPPMPTTIGSGVIDPAMFFVDGFPSEDRRTVTLRTQSAPIFAPVHTDAFARLITVGNAS
jgi:hypothetical protein